VANIDLWGLQKVTATPEYYLYEGLRQMEQAMVSIVDNIKAAFGSKTPLASKKIQTRNMSSEMTSGIKNTTTINSNLSEIFDSGNYTVGEGEPTGNFDLELPGYRGGTFNTRYYGKLEGVSNEAKTKVFEVQKKTGKSMYKWLDEIIKREAEKELNK